MKSNIKKFLVLLSMLACVFSITACDNVSSSKKSTGKPITYDESKVKASITSDLQSLSNDYSDEQLTTMKDSVEEQVGILITNWINVRKDLGTFVEITSCNFEATATTLTAYAQCTYSLRKTAFTISFDADGVITSSSFSPEYTFGEKMERAGLNTLIAISIVFSVLFLISILISSFKFINKFEKKKSSRHEDRTDSIQAVDNTITQIIQKEVNEINDLELVAVITAAIAASEGTSSNGFVVRSIRKTNKTRWQRA